MLQGRSHINTLLLLIRGVTGPHNGGSELGMKGARQGQGGVALSWFASPTTINTDYGTGAVDFSVFRHRLALFMVLIFGMGACADGADNHVLWTRATGNIMAKCPTTYTLGDQWASLVFTRVHGAVPKQERWVSHDVLKTRTVRVKESNGNRAVTSIGLPGRQPVRVAQKNKVLKTDVMGKFCAESCSRGEGGTKCLAHGGDRVQDNAGVTLGWNDGVVWSEDPSKGGAKTENVIQRRVAVKCQHKVVGRLAGPAAADQLGLFGAGVLNMFLDGADVRGSITVSARWGGQVARTSIVDEGKLSLRDGVGSWGRVGCWAGCPIEESSDCAILRNAETELWRESRVKGVDDLFTCQGVELWLCQKARGSC